LLTVAGAAVGLGQTNGSYATESIYLQANSYVKDGIRYPVGFLGANLKKEFELYPESMTWFRKHRTKRIIGSVVRLAGLGLLIGASATDDRDTFDLLSAGGLTLTFISLPISRAAENNLNKAVWIRNGALTSN
jgi:hypothetical protein